MAAERKTLTQLSVPICLETLFYMLSGMVDTLMLSSVSDQAVGAVGTANTYISVFIIMFGVISSGMIAVMSQNIGAGRPGIAYQARQLGLIFNALIGIVMSVVLATFSGGILRSVSGGFFVRIDNIMCSDDWEPYECKVGDNDALRGLCEGAAWLSSARAVRCRLKCHNERNPSP